MAQPSIPSLDFTYAFSIRIDTGSRVDFAGPMRTRSYEPATGGEVSGPRLQGRVVPQSGADYASNEMMDAHLMLQANDGTWIYMNVLGYEHEDDTGADYFRVAPYFDAPSGEHEWLTRTVFIATGERLESPSRVVLHCYEVL